MLVIPAASVGSDTVISNRGTWYAPADYAPCHPRMHTRSHQLSAFGPRHPLSGFSASPGADVTGLWPVASWGWPVPRAITRIDLSVLPAVATCIGLVQDGQAIAREATSSRRAPL